MQYLLYKPIQYFSHKKTHLRESFNWLGKDDVIRTFANILINDFRYPNKEMKAFLEILKYFKLNN